MPEGTPTQRRWPTKREVAEKMRARLVEVVPGNILNRIGDHPQIDAILEDCYEVMGYDVERKISRLTERLKDAIFAGAFGPLVIPNTVDVNGNQIPTPVGEIAMAFRDIYTEDFLALFDEEGNLLDPDAGGA